MKDLAHLNNLKGIRNGNDPFHDDISIRFRRNEYKNKHLKR